MLRPPAVERDDIEKICKLRILSMAGTHRAAEAMALVETGLGRASINHENGRRHIGKGHRQP